MLKGAGSFCRVCSQWRAHWFPPRTLQNRHSECNPETRRVASSLLSLRHLRTSPVVQESEGEKKITDILTEQLKPSFIQVKDISGGCGSMYEIVIDSEQFQGKRLLQQHRMINDALGEEIVKSLHGLTIRVGNPMTKS